MSRIWPISDLPCPDIAPPIPGSSPIESDIMEVICSRISGFSIIVDIALIIRCCDSELLIVIAVMSELGLEVLSCWLAAAHVGTPTSAAPANAPATICAIERTVTWIFLLPRIESRDSFSISAGHLDHLEPM